ncbi:MAG: hypothetical protein ACRDZX_18765 [Acidimicrobiales bacterium]
MASRVYGLYGWRVSSAVPLGPVALADGPGEVDLRWSMPRTGGVPTVAPRGTVLAEFPRGEAGWKMYWLSRGDRGFVLRMPGYAELRASPDLRGLSCRRSPGVPVAQVRDFFCGNAMSLLLSLAGAAVFHASAVAFCPPGRPGGTEKAVAVFGGRGAGKSTLAALLTAAGGRFLTDDVLRVGTEGGVSSVVGGCSELRLRQDAAGLAELFPEAAARATPDARLALALGDGAISGVALGLLVFPRLAEGPGEVSMRGMGQLEAALSLAGAPRMTGWSDRQVLEAQFGCAAHLASSVPAVRVELPPHHGRAAALGKELAGCLGAVLWGS